jgi:hypothetical protein
LARLFNIASVLVNSAPAIDSVQDSACVPGSGLPSRRKFGGRGRQGAGDDIDSIEVALQLAVGMEWQRRGRPTD